MKYEKLLETRQGEPSCAIHERVAAARALQVKRFKGTRLRTNADMDPAEVREHCWLDEAGQRLMQAAKKTAAPLGVSTTACSRSPARSPIWPAPLTSRRRIWPRCSSSGREEWSSNQADYCGAAVAMGETESAPLLSRA
jgi:Magnesium chelatase, subunit ChlI C-terminal